MSKSVRGTDKSGKSMAGNIVIWLIGILVLSYYAKIIVAEITIWGLLGVGMMWSLFCIRK